MSDVSMKTTTGLFFFFFFLFFFFFVCCWLPPPASGVPVHRPSRRLVAFVGENVTLPCRLTPPVDPSPVTAVEWFWLDDLTRSWVTVHVSRGGKELLKEKSSAYRRSTAVMKDGSLMLFTVQQRDNGTYRCVLVRRSSEREEAQVTLLVVRLPEVNFSVNRTEANRLMVYCESSGWKQKPEVSIRDLDGNRVAVQMEFPDQDDGLHAVRTLVSEGNGTFICRVEIPGGNAMNENKISVSDQFIPGQEGPNSSLWIYVIAVAGVLLLVALVALLAICVPKLIDFLRLKLWLTGDGVYTESGDINKIQTSGASMKTVKEAGPNTGAVHSGTDASGELAKHHFNEMLKYRLSIMRVGRRLNVHPCLIAGIISRQSEAGKGLNEDGEFKGYGKQDSNCFGLMQINQKYHAVKGGPYSEEHLDHGVTILIQSIKTMTRENPKWTKEDQLKGALACYIAGEPNVMGLAPEDVDSKTPNGDFANDVIARAQWFARNRFM